MAELDNLKGAIKALFDGAETVFDTKSVVGDPVVVGDTTIIPLIDISFGMGTGGLNGKSNSYGGGMGAKMEPTAVLIIKENSCRIVDIKNKDSVTKILDMVPDLIDRFTKKPTDDLSEEDLSKAKSAVEDMFDTEK
ncbi:MAG: GerW family sporulation protein [Lachnospiraceae bacterium]|nr:GerW family sporulation protein [Lachnospiraceae bacterium]